MWSNRDPKATLTPVREEESFSTAGGRHRQSMQPEASSETVDRVEIQASGTRASTVSFSSPPNNPDRSEVGPGGRSRHRSTSGIDGQDGEDGVEEGGDNAAESPEATLRESDDAQGSRTDISGPTLTDAPLTSQNDFKCYKTCVYFAASLASNAEGYAILLPVLFSIIYSYIVGQTADELSSWSTLLIKTSIFIGFPIGHMLSLVFTPSNVETEVSMWFGVLALASALPPALGDLKLGDRLQYLVISSRICLGIGLGGLRPMTVLKTLLLSSQHWRGFRMVYIASQKAFGYMSVIVAAVFIGWVHRKELSKPISDGCDEDCRKNVNKVWQYVNAVLCFPLLFTTAIRYICSQHIPRPVDPSEFYIQNQPGYGFGNFRRKFTQSRYWYPLTNICILTFVSNATFFGILMNFQALMDRFEHLKPQKEYTSVIAYLKPWAGGWLILICCGVIPAYFFLMAVIDKLGRKWAVLFALPFVTTSFLFQTVNRVYRYQAASFGMVIPGILFLTIGSVAASYVHAPEVFPKKYRVFAYMFVDIAGSVGAIYGIVSTELILKHVHLNQKFDEVAIVILTWLILSIIGVFPALALVETARKDDSTIGGEVYGDWRTQIDQRYAMNGNSHQA